jgi:hypothetical protein
MQSLPQVTLVDIHGNPITPPAASWPSWPDRHRWAPTEASDDEPTAAERAEFEAYLARAEASEVGIDQEEAWDFPRRRQIG